MLKSITKFSVNNPVSVSMIILAVLLFGYISFQNLGVDLFPNLNNPRLFIEVEAGEYPPEEMEDKFIDKIESMAIRQSGVVNVSSTSRVGISQIEVEYTWNQDMDEAFLDLSKALSSYNQNDEIDELNISQHDPNSDPVMLVALEHAETKDLNELRKVADNYIKNELIRLEGIADVEIDGEIDIEVLVETNDYLLESYDLSISTISNKIDAYNQNVSGGYIVESGKRYIVRGLSELEQVKDVEDLIIKMPNTNNSDSEKLPVLLRDVAKVSYAYKDAETAALINGEPCIGLSIYKETRYNTVKAVEELNIALREMEKSLPGFSFTIIEDQGEFVSGAIGEVRDSAIGGIVLAVFVLLVFLRKIGPTLIISAVIPISIIATFALMYFTNLTLNIMTLGGLALGAGMLVDNAIVVLENIFRNHELGKDEKEAAIFGTSQVGGAIIASTLTTIVVFLPIVYVHGAAGELFKEQTITIAFSLVCSLFAAILLIPMLYAGIYKKKKQPSTENKKSVEITSYGNFLQKVLQFRTWILLGAVILLCLGWLMFKQLGSEFMPKTESNEFYVDVQMPQGTMLGHTIGAVKSIESVVREISNNEVNRVYSEIGPTSGLSNEGEDLFADQNMATIKVTLQDNASYPVTSIIKAVTDFYADNGRFTILCRQEETALQSILGTESEPVVVELVGEETEILEELSITALKILDSIPGLHNLESSVEGGAPEVEIKIDRYRAGLMEIEVGSIISAVSEKLEGTVASQMDINGELKDINVKLEDLSLRDLQNLSFEIGNQEVLLSEVADIGIGSSPKEILHNNQNRVVKITGDLTKGIPLDKISTTISEKLSTLDFPTGYKFRITGEEAMRKESMGSLSFALLLSLILVYMVLASQFESLVHPFTIILTIPLAVVGALALFFFLGKSLNIMALIGIVMLVGIAVNDSIILVDAINQFRKEGLGLKDAIVAAGQRRIRPIIMTTLTTILALVPLTIGFGESASLRSPMAWAVIGGLVTSTLLTLIVIPCVYHLFAQIESRLFAHKNKNA